MNDLFSDPKTYSPITKNITNKLEREVNRRITKLLKFKEIDNLLQINFP